MYLSVVEISQTKYLELPRTSAGSDGVCADGTIQAKPTSAPHAGSHEDPIIGTLATTTPALPPRATCW